MPHSLQQVAYSPEGWVALVKNPHNRFEAIRPAIERLGGKVLNGCFAFREYGIVAIVEMPTNVDAAAMPRPSRQAGMLTGGKD